MRIRKSFRYSGALIAVGVFLGRGAHADTTITFNCAAVANHADLPDCIPPQVNNPNAPPGITNYGNFVAASSPGIVVSGFGTPNIGLTWGSDNLPDTRWEYYNTSGGLWGDGTGGSGVVQLQDSAVGTTEEITFAPNNPSAGVVVKSFAFFAYYNDNERFTYNVRVVSGTNVLSSQTISFLSDGTKNHPVTINYTGTPGQTLKLQLRRVASTLGVGEIEGNAYNNAVDDIAFAQTPATTFPAGPQVASVSPADDTSGLPANSSPPYSATITNSPTLTVASPIQLKLDYALVSPPPTITPLGGGQTSVTYPGAASLLLASGPHVYTLTYADNLGGVYTNEVVFNTIYATLPAAYAIPRGAGLTNGFTFRTVSASTEATNMDSTISRAVAQLNGTLTNPASGLPYTNSAALGPNPDGSFNVDTVLNFDGDGFDEGDFPNDDIFPGLELGGGPYVWFSTEALLYLDLPAGYYRFGVNSDDGFQVNALPPQGIAGSPIQLGVFDNGRGAADTLFDVLVTTSGIYPFQVIYFQSTQKSTEEFFSVTNFATGDKVLINDPTDPNATKSYRVLKPRITSIARNGANAAVSWAYGTPPFQVQFKTNVNDIVWNNIGSTTSNRTANVPIQTTTGFIRVFGH
jgi:hypothetical protein